MESRSCYIVGVASALCVQCGTYVQKLAFTNSAPSKSAARRTIGEGGAYANNSRVEDPAAQPARSDLHHGQWLVLRRGKKAFAGVRVTGA